MDRIYSQSVLTFVALSGESATRSLPGVEPGSPRIPLQRTEQAASWIFTEILPTLDRVLKHLCDLIRAWTL